MYIYAKDKSDNAVPVRCDSSGFLLIRSGLDVSPVTTAVYVASPSDNIIHVEYTATGPCEIKLPSAKDCEGKIIVKDAGGNASVNNITLTPASGETIDGAASASIAADYDCVTIYPFDDNWWVS